MPEQAQAQQPQSMTIEEAEKAFPDGISIPVRQFIAVRQYIESSAPPAGLPVVEILKLINALDAALSKTQAKTFPSLAPDNGAPADA